MNLANMQLFLNYGKSFRIYIVFAMRLCQGKLYEAYNLLHKKLLGLNLLLIDIIKGLIAF